MNSHHSHYAYYAHSFFLAFCSKWSLPLRTYICSIVSSVLNFSRGKIVLFFSGFLADFPGPTDYQFPLKGLGSEIQNQKSVVDFIIETMKTVEIPLEFIFSNFAVVGILQ